KKLRLPTNLSESVLNTWPTNSPDSDGATGTSAALSPWPLVPLRLRPCSGDSATAVSESSNSATPMSFLADVQKIGTTVPAASALGSVAFSSSVLTSPSSKYFSMRLSSDSTMASTSLERACARSTSVPAGGAGGLSTLTTPLNWV